MIQPLLIASSVLSLSLSLSLPPDAVSSPALVDGLVHEVRVVDELRLEPELGVDTLLRLAGSDEPSLLLLQRDVIGLLD